MLRPKTPNALDVSGAFFDWYATRVQRRAGSTHYGGMRGGGRQLRQGGCLKPLLLWPAGLREREQHLGHCASRSDWGEELGTRRSKDRLQRQSWVHRTERINHQSDWTRGAETKARQRPFTRGGQVRSGGSLTGSCPCPSRCCECAAG